MSRIVAQIQALAIALGAPGLCLVAFLDSSFLPLPELNDLLLVFMVTAHKPLMPLYVLAAIVGSIAGSFVLFMIGRRGGYALVRKRFGGARVERSLGWLQRYGVVSVIVPCLLPPPAPYKLFMLLAGAAGIGTAKFVLAIAIGRGIRFLALGVLAVRYGDRALQLIHDNGETVSLAMLGLLVAAVAGYLLWSKAQGPKARYTN
jgi:membrane protein YqaA with SNARE-associated domain